jgi:transposase
MGRRAYSDDIRGLVVSEVAAGASRRAAAQRFRVSASSAIRWVDRHEKTGNVSPQKERKPRSPLVPHHPLRSSADIASTAMHDFCEPPEMA